ncbi:hypothetical protein ACWEV4_12205 [Streptomyces sp. NPDC003860]
MHTVDVATPHQAKTDEAKEPLKVLRAWVPQALDGIDGVESGVGGEVARGADFTGHLAERIPWVVASCCC